MEFSCKRVEISSMEVESAIESVAWAWRRLRTLRSRKGNKHEEWREEENTTRTL
jgi:hypothetical protein